MLLLELSLFNTIAKQIMFLVVLGCSEQMVENADEALSWLGVGNAARITEATQMNQRSSRSHAVFTVHLSECGL